MDVFVGTILAVGFTFAPRGWAFCSGQLMSISQNSALFALLGTTYGGDGQQTFGLPDLRGRVIVGAQGTGPGITPVVLGQIAGTNNVTVIGTGAAVLTAANVPAHSHPATLSLTGLTGSTTLQAYASGTNQTANPVAGAYLCNSPGGPGLASIYSTSGTQPVDLGGVATTVGGSGTVTVGDNTGGGAPVPIQTTAQASIMQPYLGINYIIALEGIFPSRN